MSVENFDFMRQPLTGKTQLLGIIGDPVEHSLSPVMQNAAIAQLGLDYIYVPFPVKGEQLREAIAGFSATGVMGFNVTIPHKQSIMPLLDQLTSTAQLVGAVNTVWRTESGWCGTNTDVAGFMAPLQSYDWDWSQIQPIILGNGGAARAVVVGCQQLGCQTLHVVGRNLEKLRQFQASWPQDENLAIALKVHDWEQLASLLSSAQLVINTTPVGMAPHVQRSPLTPESIARLPATAILYDLIYTPRPTQLLRDSQQQGLGAIDGVEMLVRQGAAALQQWVDQPVPIATMRQALLQQLSTAD